MRKVVLYASVALIIFFLASQGTMVSKKVATNDYQEECLSEGCSDEEVRELWVSYKEECINEGCSKEEIIELGGTPQGALAMLRHFKRLGFEVRDKDFLDLDCTGIKTDTKCIGVLMFCKDFWQCPSGVHESSWYVCGGCLGASC